MRARLPHLLTHKPDCKRAHTHTNTDTHCHLIRILKSKHKVRIFFNITARAYVNIYYIESDPAYKNNKYITTLPLE